MIQLGLSLPAPEALRASFVEAKERRSGLLMVDSPRNGRSAVTSFKFPQKANGKEQESARFLLALTNSPTSCFALARIEDANRV
jgi:hypothetical protein